MATEACLGHSEPSACVGWVPGIKFQPIREGQVCSGASLSNTVRLPFFFHGARGERPGSRGGQGGSETGSAPAKMAVPLAVA